MSAILCHGSRSNLAWSSRPPRRWRYCAMKPGKSPPATTAPTSSKRSNRPRRNNIVTTSAADRGYAFHFNPGVSSQAGRPESAPGGVRARKKRFVDFVESPPLGYVRQHHRALHDVTHGVTMHLKGAPDVFQRLPRLGANAARNKLQCSRNIPDLPG